MKFFLTFCVFSAVFLSAFAQDKNSVTLYSTYLKGLLYSHDGNFREGLKELEKAKRKDPGSLHIRLKIASILIRLGEIEKAEKALKEAKKIDSGSLDASLALIFLYSYTQKTKELDSEYEDFLKRAHQQKPQDLSISEYLAQFYFYKREYQKAIEIYEAVLKNSPDNIDAIIWLGYLYDETARRPEAIRLWERGLKINPNNAGLLNTLGYTYADEGIKLDEAEKMIRQALEKEPANGAYLDSLGWVYFKKADYKRAEEYLKKAIDLLKDPAIYVHLGDLYIVLNNPEESRRYYEEGLKQFPDNSDLQRKLEKYGKKD